MLRSASTASSPPWMEAWISSPPTAPVARIMATASFTRRWTPSLREAKPMSKRSRSVNGPIPANLVGLPPPEIRVKNHFTSVTPAELIHHLSTSGHKRVWLVGGSQLAASFRAAGLITEYVLSFVPLFLGTGRPLFAGIGPVENLRLVESKPYPSGWMQLRYVQAGGAS